MLNELLLWLLGILVIDPAVAEMRDRLGQLQAPPGLIAQVRECAAVAPAAVTDKLVANPWWGVRTGVGVALGLLKAEQVLADAAPGCARAWQALGGEPRS